MSRKKPWDWGAARIAAVNDAQECIVWCKGHKISFVCVLPFDSEMQWKDLVGTSVDDRPPLQCPCFESRRHLKPLGKGDWQAMKQLAFSALQRAREKEREKIEREFREPRFAF